MNIAPAHLATWSIAAVSVLGVITRPRNWSEAWWAGAGALALVLLELIQPADALRAVGKGTDVYLFLTGMMVLAELARREGVFDWAAGFALAHARGSGRRLFLLVYAVGTLVTIFLSNDATAVVLTPAVYTVAKRAQVQALPYLLICAFIANAASFVLPISNPANLVVYGGGQMPRLGTWLIQFGLASLVSIIATYLLLRLNQRRHIPARIGQPEDQPQLSMPGRVTVAVICLTAVVLLVASVLGWQLGLPTFIAAAAGWLLISALKRAAPWPVLRGISWDVLPLVAGLFVLVEAVQQTGALTALITAANGFAHQAPRATGFVAGAAVGFAANLINNLPMGLIGATVVHSAQLSPQVAGAVLLGVDLGPNLSVTGSLATILWLASLRREGENVSAWTFLAVGIVVMPLSLVLTLTAYLLTG